MKMERQTKKDEGGAVGATIEIDLGALESLRRRALNVKRMGKQAADSADELIVEIDSLKRQATDSETR